MQQANTFSWQSAFASAGNGTRVTSMATMYSATRPLMLLQLLARAWHDCCHPIPPMCFCFSPQNQQRQRKRTFQCDEAARRRTTSFWAWLFVLADHTEGNECFSESNHWEDNKFARMMFWLDEPAIWRRITLWERFFWYNVPVRQAATIVWQRASLHMIKQLVCENECVRTRQPSQFLTVNFGVEY